MSSKLAPAGMFAVLDPILLYTDGESLGPLVVGESKVMAYRPLVSNARATACGSTMLAERLFTFCTRYWTGVKLPFVPTNGIPV